MHISIDKRRRSRASQGRSSMGRIGQACWNFLTMEINLGSRAFLWVGIRSSGRFRTNSDGTLMRYKRYTDGEAYGCILETSLGMPKEVSVAIHSVVLFLVAILVFLVGNWLVWEVVQSFRILNK